MARAPRKGAAPTAAPAPDLTYIHPALRAFARPLDTLTLDPGNARLHDERNLTAIADSLTVHGQILPLVVDATGVVRAGNGRVVALRRLGRTHAACVPFQGNEAESIAFGLRDNRTAELAKWDFEALTRSLRELQDRGIDLAGVGWNEQEFGPLLAATWTPPAPTDLEGKPSRGTGDKRVESDLAFICDTVEQATLVRQALGRLRALDDGATLTDGRALELICADYLAGAE